MHPKRFEELKATGQLPSPTGVGLAVLRLARDDKSSANDIAHVVQADPVLTGRTLKLANTGNAAASRPVTNIADAVARLGTRTVTGVALAFSTLAGNRSGKCHAFDYKRFWSHSLAYAVGAQILCSHTKKIRDSDGFTAGLLAQIGRLAFAGLHPEKYASVLTEWNGGSPADLLERERATFVTDHNELGAAILTDWGLPRSITEAVLFQETPSGIDPEEGSNVRVLARILNAAARLADVCVAPSDAIAAAYASDLLSRSESVGIGSDAIFALFEQVFAEWAEWGRVLEVPTNRAPRLAELLDPSNAGHAAPLTGQQAAASASAFSAFFIKPASEPGVAVSNERESQKSGALVLIADPEPPSLRFLERFLALSGHGVRCAKSSEEALHLFYETAPHLAIIDAALPAAGGLELCRRLRQTAAGQQAYIIVLAAANDEETMARMFEAGADDFVTKPFTASALFARLRSSLRVVELQARVNLDRQEIQRLHSELAIAHRRLEQDALTDVLTALPNRRYFVDRLAHDWAAARRGGTPLTCMMVDIDHFKGINDTYGHDVGDVVLQGVARVLRDGVRATDVVCRYGGDEFVVLSAADFESTQRCAERLRAAIEKEFEGEGPVQEPVTVSIGVALRSEQTRTPEALMKAADEALFAAKRQGRNRIAGDRDGNGFPMRANNAERSSATAAPAALEISPA